MLTPGRAGFIDLCQMCRAMVSQYANRLLNRLALQPGRTTRIQSLDFGPLQAGHIALHRVADAGLQISEMPVARWELLEQNSVQCRLCARRYRVHAILLIDRLAQHDAPALLALFEEIVEPSSA